MRRAWQRELSSVDERLRSSSSAWAPSGPSRSGRAGPARAATCWTAGSISWLTSLKRTDWGGSWGVVAMVMAGSGQGRAAAAVRGQRYAMTPREG